MSNAQNSASKETILIVDDIPENLQLLAGMLSEQGYIVRLAPDGQLALQFVQVSPPDLILLDILMPDMDGYEVCKELKTSPTTQCIPVIFISALHEVFDKVKAFSVGGVDYITKPFEVREVLARVENQLRLSRFSKQLLEQNARLSQEIEERKRIEHERKQAQEALQASEAELRALFAAIPDPLFVINSVGRVLKLVPLAPEQLYKPADEQIGRTLHEIFEQAQADIFLSYIQQALSTQQILNVEYSLTMGGREIWFAARISPISQDLVIWLARDITDRKRAEEASILEERNRIAREIHDTLAQALTGVIVHMEVAKVVVPEDSKARNHLIQAHNLARDGLAEARRSVWALRPQVLEQGGISQALESLVHGLTAGTPIKGECTIEKTRYPLPSHVETNLLRIAQEAFVNALKHARASAIQVELTFASQAVSLCVRDNGQGFNPELLRGKGFGLVGMRERIQSLGGRLTIASQPGQGTEVIAVVPLGYFQKLLLEDEGCIMSQKQPICILIADDHPIVRAGIAAMLEIDPEANLTVVGQANNGCEAVALFAQLQPDIALIDLQMPQMDGVTAIAAIRKKFPTARLIVLTTYDRDEDIYRGLQAGAKAYLLKDTPREELLACIQAVHVGRSFIPMEVGARLAERMNSPELSKRECEVLQLMTAGMSNLEIGEALTITEGTVKSHINNILSKLNVNDRTQAVIIALKRGIVALP
jgi:two-component system NarL family sensor kinase